MRKRVRILLITVLSLVALLALVLLLLSPVAKGYVNRHGRNIVGREMHVDKLKVNALTGRVVINGFTIYEEDDSTAFFSFDTLDVSVKLRRLLCRDLHVRHLTLAKPQVRILQDGNRFNFSSIIDHFASDEEDDDDTTSSPWSLGFYNIRLSDGNVYYADRKLGSTWDLNNLNFVVPGVYFDGRKSTDAGLDLRLADGGSLHTEASLNLDDNTFNALLQLHSVSVANARAYLTNVMNVSDMKGRLSTTLNVTGNLSDILNMDIGGDLSLEGLEVRDGHEAPLLSLGRLATVVSRINIKENLFYFKSVELTGLRSHFDNYEDGTNFSRLFAVASAASEPQAEEQPAPAKAAEEPGEVQPSKPFQLRCGQLAISDVSVTYNDYSLPDPFSFPVTNLNISASDLSSSGENAARIRASLPHGGIAIINWKGNLSDWKAYQRLSLNIRNLRLADLSPYSVAYLGYPFSDGTFSFTSENTIRDSRLNGNNLLDLFNPTVGKKRKDVKAQINVPLNAALYVLKDKDNKVEFAVPVKGNIDSPEFSYMKIVWKTLGNLLLKVATSPMRMLSGSNGNIDFLEINPIQLDFTSEQYSTLSRIASVLQFDSSFVLTFQQQLDVQSAAHEQLKFNFKKGYYLKLHPEKAESGRLEMIDYTNIEAISDKDSGYKAYLKSISQNVYILADAEEEVRQTAERRNQFLLHYFVDQMGVLPAQVRFAPTLENASRNGYALIAGSDGEEEQEE